LKGGGRSIVAVGRRSRLFKGAAKGDWSISVVAGGNERMGRNLEHVRRSAPSPEGGYSHLLKRGGGGQGKEGEVIR